MTRQLSQDENSKPHVVIASDYHALALSVLEILLQKQCRVSVFTKDAVLWKRNTVHIDEKLLKIGASSGEPFENPDYLIIFALKGEKITRDILLKAGGASKILIVSPFGRKITITDPSLSAAYVKDLYGPRMDFSEAGLPLILAQAIGAGVARLPERGSFFPTFIPDAAREIVRMLLSFSPPAGEIALLGQELSSAQLAGILTSAGVNISAGGEKKEEPAPTNRIQRTKTPFVQGLKETFEWGKSHGVSVPKTEKVRLPKSPNKVRRILILLATCLMLLPFILLFISGGALLAGKSFIVKAKTGASKNAAYLAKGTSRGASFGFGIYTSVPGLGRAFRPLSQSANILERSSEIMLKGATVAEDLGSFGEKILGDEVYDPGALSQGIYLNLDNLYQDLGFLDSEIKEQGTFLKTAAGWFMKESDLTDLRTKVLQLKGLFLEAPALLGKDKPVAYLLLFQNNMELRPSGGFIGSLAIITFDGGRLSDVNVQDVYSLDGQLKGHVEPPEPIKNYLGEANWFLRDSNWDPDFPTSASRAEWFLSKEIGKSVDGVVSLDLEAAKSILRITGPITLADFGQDISADNLYEKTQSEVEESFFPGSIKKASFLTALARELLAEVFSLPKEKDISLGKSLVENLERRHIQIFLHRKEAQRAISGLGFDGSFQTPSCLGNCYSDFVGLIEANLGVNKANYFIKRAMNMEVSIEGDTVTRKLSVSYENSANPALGLSGRYKVYLRLFVPLDSEVGEPMVGQGQEANATTPDILDSGGKREVGFLLEIMPGQTETVTFSWSGKNPLLYDQSGEYRLYWRKQAGTNEDPVSLRMVLPAGVSGTPSLGATLTKDGAFVYNTVLARDLFSRVSW